MGKDLNAGTWAGRLGRDPELKAVGDSNVCNFSIAVADDYKNQAGQKVDRTHWFDCVIWGDQAVNFANWLAKGDKVIIKGSLEQQTWQAQDGSNRSKIVIRVDPFYGWWQIDRKDTDGTRKAQPSKETKPEGDFDPKDWGAKQQSIDDEDDIPF